jgi:hypothetical protein
MLSKPLETGYLRAYSARPSHPAVRFSSFEIFDSTMKTRSFHQRQHAPGQRSPGMGSFGLQVILRANDRLDTCRIPD